MGKCNWVQDTILVTGLNMVCLTCGQTATLRTPEDGSKLECSGKPPLPEGWSKGMFGRRSRPKPVWEEWEDDD